MKLLLFVQIINVTFAPTLQLCPEFMVSDFLLVWFVLGYPCWVVGLLACCMGVFRNSHQAVVWGAVPSCILWFIWREQNCRIF